MLRYDKYTDRFISDNIDMRSYMIGYLNGCADSIKKFDLLTKIKLNSIYGEQHEKENN